MENENIRIKKGATARDSILVLLGFIMLFSVGVLFITGLANDYGVANQDPQFNETAANLAKDQADIQENIDTIQDFANAVTEASFGDFAYFGLKGILAVMKTPFQLVNIAGDMWSQTSSLFDFIPSQMKTFILAGIITIMTFIAIKFLTSRGQEP